ncbi:MAG: VirB3 family type IV secretion system protein [Pseudomonadota bacterium]
MELKPTVLFTGLTREVSFAGLPLMYLVVLIGIVMLGFIVLQSFVYLSIVGPFGYVALRALAAYDPKIIDVFIATVQSTSMNVGLFNGKGVIYRA